MSCFFSLAVFTLYVVLPHGKTKQQCLRFILKVWHISSIVFFITQGVLIRVLDLYTVISASLTLMNKVGTMLMWVIATSLP
jgi:arginine exporter protein ArgO